VRDQIEAAPDTTLFIQLLTTSIPHVSGRKILLQGPLKRGTNRRGHRRRLLLVRGIIPTQTGDKRCQWSEWSCTLTVQTEFRDALIDCGYNLQIPIAILEKLEASGKRVLFAPPTAWTERMWNIKDRKRKWL